MLPTGGYQGLAQFGATGERHFRLYTPGRAEGGETIRRYEPYEHDEQQVRPKPRPRFCRVNLAMTWAHPPFVILTSLR